MFDLKVDPSFPHHYIFSVGVKSMLSSNPGEFFLKHGPIHFTNEDVEKVQNAVILTKDDLYQLIYKTTNKEILQVTDCADIVNQISMMKFAAAANNCTLHHYSTEDFMDDYRNFFITYVELVNTNNKYKGELYAARC